MGFMDGLRHIGRVQAACNDTRHGCALNDGPVNASVMGQSGCPYIVGSICLCINQEEIGNRLILLYVFQGFLLLNGYILKDRDGMILRPGKRRFSSITSSGLMPSILPDR